MFLYFIDIFELQVFWKLFNKRNKTSRECSAAEAQKLGGRTNWPPPKWHCQQCSTPQHWDFAEFLTLHHRMASCHCGLIWIISYRKINQVRTWNHMMVIKWKDKIWMLKIFLLIIYLVYLQFAARLCDSRDRISAPWLNKQDKYLVRTISLSPNPKLRFVG